MIEDMPARSGTLDAIDAARAHIDHLKCQLEGELGGYHQEQERLRARVIELEARLARADAILVAIARAGFDGETIGTTGRIIMDVIGYIDSMRRK